MQALLLPKILRQGSESTPVEMIARTGGRRIKIQVTRGTGHIFAVDRWRLYSADGRRRVSDAEFDALPWQGSGPDPRESLLAAAPSPSPASRARP